MRKHRECLVGTAILCALAAVAWAIGADIPLGMHIENPTASLRGRPVAPIWPDGLAALANSRPYVHAFEVNMTPYLFYAGDTAAFNDFAKQYSAVSGIKHEVVLYIGPKQAISPWDEKERDIDTNWGLDLPTAENAYDAAPGAPLPSRIDLWLGGSIDLKNLNIPANVTVRSGGDIEKFIAAREKHRK